MSVIDRLRKRRCYPITIDGKVIHIRALLGSELDAVSEFRDEEESVGCAIGWAVVNEDRSPAFTQTPGETPKEFGARILKEVDLPSDTKAELTEKILKLASGPIDIEQLKKN